MNKKFFLYFFFALIATIFNLLTQRLILYISQESLFLIFAIFSGTLVGLLIKFYLDQNFIFSESKKKKKNRSLTFSLYAIMGIFSTTIFWVIEITFWLIWRDEKMRELGALIGLTLGYIIKYYLDKNFVFKS